MSVIRFQNNLIGGGGSVNVEKRRKGAEDNISALLSFIAHRRNEPYAFYTGKTDILKKL